MLPTPPLSPVLLAGHVVRPLPPVLFQPLANLAMAAAIERYPGLFARLRALPGAAFLIEPVDLPFRFLLRPAARPPSLAIVASGARTPPATATIRGPLFSLLDLLEGRADGDALFFSRDLVVEGDTEAVLALRNAVDGADVAVADVLAAALGPFSGVVQAVAGRVGGLLGRAAHDLARLQDALIAPAVRRCEDQANELRALRAEVADLRRRVRPGPARP